MPVSERIVEVSCSLFVIVLVLVLFILRLRLFLWRLSLDLEWETERHHLKHSLARASVIRLPSDVGFHL